jgi:hypothetical protein
MHNKQTGAAALEELHKCELFNEVVAAVRQLALPGVRTPFSNEAVQCASYHNAVGIHSLLERQNGELSHFFAAHGLRCPSAGSAHVVQADLHAAAEAVAQVFNRKGDVGTWRETELLQPLERQLNRLHEWDSRLNELKPLSVAAVAGGVPIATIACLVKALDWPHKELPLCLLCGFDIVGEIPATGVYPRALPKESATDPNTLDHAADNAAMMQKLAAAGRLARGTPAEQALIELMAVSQKAVDKGYATFVTVEELDREFGVGGWRLIERFGVEQNGAVRACDNAKEGRQNECSDVGDRLLCERADLPALMADLMYRLCGGAARVAACTDDLEKAYWKVPNSQPEFALVAQYDPVTRCARIMRVPGLSFGLVASVTSFNVLAEFTTHVARRLAAIVTGHYYDDYVTMDPGCAGTSAKESLHWLHRRLGFPFSTDEEKCKPMADKVVFVGIVTDLRGFKDGLIRLDVKPGRVEKITAIAGAMMGTQVPHAKLQSLVGKLQFTVSTIYGRFGRAAIQAINVSDGDARSGTLLHESLHFFVACLGTLRGKERRLGSHMARELSLVWSDAMYTARADAETMADVIGYETGLGYIAYDVERVLKTAGRRTCPQEILLAMMAKMTYIGQLELIAILLVYWSEPERFAGRDVIHFVDNTSAIYCAIKDYSKSPDSARIVHCIHAVLVAFDINVWFEYVPSKENISDGPSRGESALVESLGFKFGKPLLPSAADLFSVTRAWRAAQKKRRPSSRPQSARKRQRWAGSDTPR